LIETELKKLGKRRKIAAVIGIGFERIEIGGDG
jgi:hypothetical protein